MSSDDNFASAFNSLRLMSDRPGETLITPKGSEGAVFQLPSEDFLPGRYKQTGIVLNNRFGEDSSQKIELKPLKTIPKFKLAEELPNDAEFSVFLPKHQAMASEVIDVLMKVPENELDDFVSTCAFARANLNSQLFNYCFSVALLHRNDTRNKAPIPQIVEHFPAKFLDTQVFTQARAAAAVIPAGSVRKPIIIPRDYTATDLEEEHRLAYWREDIGVNLHHWHWHLIYPGTSTIRSIVAKDRRGELFFYMHQQIIARYNGERLCNSLKRVKKFNNWREPIPEAYYPKLDSLTTSRGWPPRQANMKWQNIDRKADGLKITISDMERWRRNIEDAIATGTVQLPNGSTQRLDIDTLGNMLEPSMLSPNPELYGAIHNNGHNFSAYMHDPNHRYLESMGVIADEATTMRDPLFYRWHAWVDDVFQRHKESSHVSPYSRSELENQGVQVTSVTIESANPQKNVLNTFWMLSDVDLSKGLDFSDRGAVYARFTHLCHRPFSYLINVNNTGSARRATVRIFMAPKYDERRLVWPLSEHRKMMIEMDRFVTPLNSGQNTITRKSSESSVTIPFEQTFRDLSAQNSTNAAINNFCGCGWPEHMLVPKGTESGIAYVLFVMLSNYELDRVDQPDGTVLSCVEASSFCGLRDRKYPDKRSMGFPFDRPISIANNIDDLNLSNVKLQDITIQLQNVTELNPRNPPT